MDHRTEQAQRLISLARWMTAQADSEGRTHGEKHHWHFVIAQVLEMAGKELGVEIQFITARSLDKDLTVDDIPF